MQVSKGEKKLIVVQTYNDHEPLKWSKCQESSSIQQRHLHPTYNQQSSNRGIHFQGTHNQACKSSQLPVTGEVMDTGGETLTSLCLFLVLILCTKIASHRTVKCALNPRSKDYCM